MDKSIDFWNGVTNSKGLRLTDEEKLLFCEELNYRLKISPELAKIFFNTQVYNNTENAVTTRGTHTEGVAENAENLAILKAELDGKSQIQQKISGLLAKILGYMHDLGHTPYGHDGEGALSNEMERFEATPDYKEKRIKIFGKDYVEQVEDDKVEVMCYEHNETSAVIATQFIEKFAKDTGYNIDEDSIQYIKTGVLAHSTSRVKEEPNGIEQKAVRLADKVAYIPQDLLDLIKQQVIAIDDLTDAEQELLGLNEKKLTYKENQHYAQLSTQEHKEQYFQKRKEYKQQLKQTLRNINKLPRALKIDLFRELDSIVKEQQVEIARKSFIINENNEVKLDARKSIVDFYEKAVNNGKIPKDCEITIVQMQGISLFKKLRDAQRMPMGNKNEIEIRKNAVNETAKNYTQFLEQEENIDTTLATLWTTKAKYQDAFIRGELFKISENVNGELQRQTLDDMNDKIGNNWKIKTVFQFFYSNINELPEDFKKRYQNGEEYIYTQQQVVSAFIASFTNVGLDSLYNELVQRQMVVSRQEAISALQDVIPEVDIMKIVSNNQEWIDPQNAEAKYKVFANDILEYLYEQKIGKSIVVGKYEILDREPIPPIRHVIAIRDILAKKGAINKTNENQLISDLLKTAIELSSEEVNSKDIQTIISLIINKQNEKQITPHIEAVKQDEK